MENQSGKMSSGTTLKTILNIFGVKYGQIVKKEEANRWRNVLQELTTYSTKDILSEYEQIYNQNQDKHQLYYMEAVRRSLMIKHGESLKKAPVAPSLKEIMKGMFL